MQSSTGVSGVNSELSEFLCPKMITGHHAQAINGHHVMTVHQAMTVQAMTVQVMTVQVMTGQEIHAQMLIVTGCQM